jgi:subtilisin-like proprotein convertase family protein
MTVILLVAPACSLDVSYENTAYHCDDGQTCPSGFQCVETLCVQTTPEEQPDAAIVGPGETAHAWLDDSAAEFRLGTGSQAAVQARGAIEPFAYYTGGLLVHASNSQGIASAASGTWAAVMGLPSTAKDSLTRSVDLRWASGERPAGVGLGGNDFTLAVEGEIFLEAGTWTFALDADDHAFLDLAGATGTFARVVNADWGTTGQGTFVAPSTGWYGLRFALTDTGGDGAIKLTFKGPGVSNFTVVPRARLRTRVDQQPGLVLAGFTDRLLVGELDATIDADAPVDVDWGSGAPADLGIAASDLFSCRWSGQWRVDQAGDYSFRYDTDNGQRLWIDGLPLASFWDQSTHDQVTTPMTLTAGWHDIVADVSETSGSARALLSVESGPDLVGEPLPVDRLRPVEARSERFETGVNHNDVAIPDNGSAQSQITLTAPAGTVVTAIDVAYAFDHTYASDLQMRLVAPNGTSVLLRDQLGGNASVVDDYDQFNGTNILTGAPVAGTWTIKFTDTQAQDTGTIKDFELTVHYSGGEAPIVTSSSYESAIRDLGNVVGIDRISWNERQPSGTDVIVRVRSCAAADCAGVAWSDPLPDPSGSSSPVTPQRYLQYRVEMTSNGDRSTSLESIKIDYRTGS